MAYHIAPKRSRVTLAADRTISANSIVVFGIIIANNLTSPVSVDFTDADGNIELTLNCEAENSIVHNIPFIADDGLLIDATGIASASVLVTVYHSHDGA